MAYKKDNLTYEKRSLTKDIALKVITKSLPTSPNLYCIILT